MKEGKISSSGGVPSSFVNWVDQRGLLDLGFTRPIFTWSHEVNIKTPQSARLDRGLCDDRWRRQFPRRSSDTSFTPTFEPLSISYAVVRISRAENGLPAIQFPCFMVASLGLLRLDGKGMAMGGRFG